MTDEPDMTDDWMNPHQAKKSEWSYRAPQPGDPKEYLIERERRIICFGDPGYVTQWDYWTKYDSAEERDTALAELSKAHPMWHLRSRDVDPYWDSIRHRVRY